MKTKYTFLLGAGILVLGILSAQSQGTLVAQHSGASDPQAEGFTLVSLFGAPQLSAVTNDLGRDTWSMSLSSAGAYYTRNLNSLADLDWRLSVTVRIARDSISERVFFTSVGTGQSLFSLFFGSDTNGDPTVRLRGLNLSPELVLPGAGATYHDFDLVYDAAAHNADLWVDGVERFSDMPGLVSSSQIMQFGGSYQNPADLQANWNLVRLEIIPEPSAFALLLLGGGVLLYRRRRLFARIHPG